jgi:hypothetical protein
VGCLQLVWPLSLYLDLNLTTSGLALNFHTLTVIITHYIQSNTQLPGPSQVSVEVLLIFSKFYELTPDMRIVPLGSGGAILDLEWFLNHQDIKLVIKERELEGKDDLLAYC